MVPDESGPAVAGLVFSSADLPAHWPRLDAFEGPGYERMLVEARLTGGRVVSAYVYALRDRPAE